jgi:hypothetical protein
VKKGKELTRNNVTKTKKQKKQVQANKTIKESN